MAPCARELTRPVMVGDVQIGGGAPVIVQSMTCTPTTDAASTLAQVRALAEAGCDIVRVSVPTKEALGPFGAICRESPVPIAQIFISTIDWRSGPFRPGPQNCGSTPATSAIGIASTP